MLDNSLKICFLQMINVIDFLLYFIWLQLQVPWLQSKALQMIPIFGIKMIIIQYQSQPELILIDFYLTSFATATIRCSISSLDVLEGIAKIIHHHDVMLSVKNSCIYRQTNLFDNMNKIENKPPFFHSFINQIYSSNQLKHLSQYINIFTIVNYYINIILPIINIIRKMSSRQIQEPLVHRSNSTYQSSAVQPLGFFSQSGLLIRKNFILTFKNPKNIIFLIITPFLLSLFMSVFGSLAADNSQRTLPEPPVRSIPQFPQCIGRDCVSLQYAIIYPDNETPDPDWIENAVNYVKKKSNLANSTVKKYDKKITTDEQLTQYYQKFIEYPNVTQIGLLFCAGSSEQFNLSLFCDGSKDFTYYIMLNKTDSLTVIFHDLLEPLPIDEVATSLKLLVDNSIFNYAQGKIDSDQMNINYTTSQFPVGQNRYIKDYDIITQIGAFYYMITPLFAFLFIQSQIVREKQYKLRQGLNVFGASHAAYWVSWFLIAQIYSIITSVSTFLAGYAFGFQFYKQTPFYIIIFFVFYPFTLAMQMMSFFLSTLSPTLKAANAISYGIVLFAIVVQSFVANNNLLIFLFSDDVSTLIFLLKAFLTLYPPFSYTKIFTHITQYSGHHFNIANRKWQKGPDYNMTIFATDEVGKLPIGGAGYTRYSDLISMLVLFADALFFIALTWYFDHVVESNRGKGESPIFFVKRIINFFIKKSKKSRVIPTGNQQLRNPNFMLQDQQESTIKQRQRVYKNSMGRLPAFGLRIKDLSKTFAKMCSKNRVEAIRSFNLEIEPNQLMCILGHNGAGKTTLINILTGVLNPDDTKDFQIIINNKSIDKINQIRKYIGVCSQFDILWNQMTAQEHLFMFARLKNVPRDRIDSRIDEMLQFVNLSTEKKAKVQSFSGGMKRRLSLAIAAIGNPKIILLDEPTTGLDPKVRQQIWDLIQKMKKGKSIILTTHSMEQADILADRLCVMVKGRLKCVGTSFYLKHKYGDGHRIALNIDDSKSKQVFRIIKKLFPKAIQVDSKGGNMIIGLSDFENLLDLIKMLENKQASGLDEFTLKKSIKDWSVSHSTLQQVFMKVTKENDHEH